MKPPARTTTLWLEDGWRQQPVPPDYLLLNSVSQRQFKDVGEGGTWEYGVSLTPHIQLAPTESSI